MTQGIRFTATNNALSYSGTLIDINAPYTVAGWVRVADVPTALAMLALLEIAGESNHDYAYFWEDGSLDFSQGRGGSESYGGSGAVTADVWMHVALVRVAANQLRVYRNGTPGTDITVSVSGSVTATRLCIGGVPGESLAVGGDFALWRVWTAGLSVRNRQQEHRRVGDLRLQHGRHRNNCDAGRGRI